jgi:diguanylate cyclase (GGDEF)-like protein
MAPSEQGDWTAGRLAEFLALLSEFDDERSAVPKMVERAGEMLGADGAALIDEEHMLAATGALAEVAGTEQLREVAAGERTSLDVLGPDEAHAVAAPVDDSGGRTLIAARAGDEFSAAEVDLVRGLGSVMAVAFRTLNLISAERALREDSEDQAMENDHLLVALRDRQALLERLSAIQRSIVAQSDLHEIFEQVIRSGCELLGDDAGLVRMKERAGDGTTIAAALGVSQEFIAARQRSNSPGIGVRAIAERDLVVFDKHSDSLVRHVPGEWAIEGLRAGMAAPIFEGGQVIGSLGTASRDPNRSYSMRDQQVLLALAEHASLALNHARALDDVVHQAFHDSLTGMPNRTLFMDRVSHAQARGEQGSSHVGVLVVDLDDFKTINDSLGHGAGDELLVQVAERLAGCLRRSDTIARLGGDEFAVLLEDVDDADGAALWAERILETLGRPFAVADREVSVAGSIGIALGDEEPETLLRDADLAMYRAKAGGKGSYEAFEPRMRTEIMERLELEVELQGAIERGELTLVYQPIFSLRTGVIAGLEALVRWRHPTRGLVPPDRFIPLAERSGRIDDVGRWVLAAACHQGALWRAKYPAHPGIQVGVNISAAQLKAPELVPTVAGALETARLDPEGLTLEITETALMDDFDDAVRRLHELKGLGIEIAVDDFGTGHSSLRYLQRLPVDNLKIAKPFVDEIADAQPSPPILRAVLDIADVFDLRPVAEGIERVEQAERLLALGCELGQGHHLSKPVPADQADDLILSAGLLGRPLGPAGTEDVLSPPGSEAGPAAAS